VEFDLAVFKVPIKLVAVRYWLLVLWEMLLLLYCTAKAIFEHGDRVAVSSLRAGRGFGRWDSVTFTFSFLSWWSSSGLFSGDWLARL